MPQEELALLKRLVEAAERIAATLEDIAADPELEASSDGGGNDPGDPPE